MDNISNSCYSCNTTFPAAGIFCGKCLTQIKCKSCNSILEKDFIGCTNCGTPKIASANNTQNNQNTFRMHQTLNERTIEATFSNDIGKEIADMLKETYSNNLKLSADNISNISKADISNNTDNIIEVEVVNFNTDDTENQKLNSIISDEDFPNIMAIAIKNLPTTEVEWIVIYSFYASNFGKEIYSRKNIIDCHTESKRKNLSFSNNLTRSLNLAINSGYINPLQEGYFLLDEGVTKAKEIINRTKGTLPKFKSKNVSKKEDFKSIVTEPKVKKTTNNEVKSLKRVSDLNLEPEKKESLKDFLKNHPCTNDHERNLVFTFYLQEILKIEKVTNNHIYTCYDYLGLRISENLPQGIRNTRNKKGWIEGENGATILTMKGRNKIKFWDNKQ